MKRDIFLLITIDTECDKGTSWKIQRPLRFSSVVKGIPQRLSPLFESYGVKPTYLLSPEVINDIESVKVLSSLENCELGTHLHGEFIPPNDFPETDRTDTPQFLYTTDIERQKLVNLTGLFESKFGFRPESFRAGRFGISRHTLSLLSELGYLVDSSVTPFCTHYYEGRGECNFWGAPLQPYRPARADPCKKGRISFLEVPVTIINPLLALLPRWILRRMNSRTRWHVRILQRFGCSVPKTLWLRPQRSSFKELMAVVENTVRIANTSRPVVLNMMYHSMEIVPGASPYAQTEGDVQLILDSQAALFTHLREHFNVRSIGLSEIYPLMSKGTREV